MQRDLELIKEILFFIEKKKNSFPEPIKILNYSEDDVDYHCTLLLDAGYIEAQVLGYGSVFPKRLTNRGHDFLDAARDPGIWKKAKDTITKHGGSFTMEIVKTVLTELIKNQLGIK